MNAHTQAWLGFEFHTCVITQFLQSTADINSADAYAFLLITTDSNACVWALSASSQPSLNCLHVEMPALVGCRQKQDLEQASAVMQEEKEKLEEEALKLAQRLKDVLQEKYVPREVFDADTPIDKTLKLLQTIIGVWWCHPSSL